MKKKWLTALLMALLLTLLGSAALAESLRFGVVDGGRTVNLRGSASANGAWLGAYEEGTWMRITGESGNYYKVKAPDGKTGYMHVNSATARMGFCAAFPPPTWCPAPSSALSARHPCPMMSS